jgi:hypothetical protein
LHQTLKTLVLQVYDYSVLMENSSIQDSTFQRIIKCFKAAWRPGVRTALWLLKITIPVSFAVTILNYFGIIAWIAFYLNPLFRLIGLPGQSGLAFITGMLLNIYSAIAVINSLSFNMREVTILAMMCLISHNLITETIIQRKTGSNALRMVILRIGMSIVSAVLLNWLLPVSIAQKMNSQIHSAQTLVFTEVLKKWIIDISYLSVKIIVLVNGLMLIQKFLDEFSLYEVISKAISPFIKSMGLPAETSFLWIIGNVVGLAYGGAIMIEEREQKKITKADANLLNHHLAVSHSTLEDTLLFMAIGVSAFWILVPRVILAMGVVWIVRLMRK